MSVGMTITFSRYTSSPRAGTKKVYSTFNSSSGSSRGGVCNNQVRVRIRGSSTLSTSTVTTAYKVSDSKKL